MHKKLISFILVAALMSLLIFQPPVAALDETDSLECSGGIVFTGDSQDSVRNKCGDPQKVTREDAASPVVWVYNFGPSEFVYYVTFTDGVVIRIQMGNYGD
jgi:hypothetical protein